MTYGSSIDNGYASTVTDSSQILNLVANSDGSYSFKYYISATPYLLTYDEDSDTVIWATDINSDTQKWYLNRVNYNFGDADCDGTVDNDDVTKLQGHIAGTSLITRPAELYLSDVNQDGSINATDVSIIQQRIADATE